MLRFSRLLILLVSITLTACALGVWPNLSAGVTPEASSDLSQQMETIVVVAHTQTTSESVSTPLPTGMVKPADSDTPVSGICNEWQGDPADIVLGSGPDGLPLAGRCIVLDPSQRIKLVNQSSAPINTKFADYSIDLPVGSEMLLDKPAGEFLAPGVHFLPSGPELWIKTTEATPVATMPGPLRHYENPEAGYSLTLPPGWSVDEIGSDSPNKEVVIYPGNAEPFVTYLSISLDFRTIDQVINLYTREVPDAVQEDTVFNGLPGVKYTYSYGRNEYYIPYGNLVYLIITDRPRNGNVQLMLMSIRFT